MPCSTRLQKEATTVVGSRWVHTSVASGKTVRSASRFSACSYGQGLRRRNAGAAGRDPFLELQVCDPAFVDAGSSWPACGSRPRSALLSL
jgi:hypothetical protein